MEPETFARIRDLVHFAYPCRPWRFIKLDDGFLDENYRRVIGTWHRGIDINGIYGGDTDLGLPVQSMFPGEVVAIAPSDTPGWGSTVLVRADAWVKEFVAEFLDEHLTVLDVQYAHLHQVSVEVGDRLNAGDHLGSIGKGDRGQYWAHLHLEVRRLPLPAVVRQGPNDEDRDRAIEECLDPRVVLERLPLADFATTLPQRRQLAPIRHFVHNGADVLGERVVVINRVNGTIGKIFMNDGRARDEPPTTFLEAIQYGIRRWRESRP